MRPTPTAQNPGTIFTLAGSPLPNISRHICASVWAISLRRVFAYRGCPIFIPVKITQRTRWFLVTPRICTPVCASCSFFPLLFCWQPLSDPLDIRNGICPGNLNDRMLPFILYACPPGWRQSAPGTSSHLLPVFAHPSPVCSAVVLYPVA